MRSAQKSISMLPLLLLCLSWGSAQAQYLERTLLSSAGMQFDAGTATLEWSVGEGIVAGFSGGEYQLTQGFHQGAGIIGRVFGPDGWTHEVVLFPNPVSRDLYLQKDGPGEFRLKIFDLLGQLVSEDIWSGNSKSLNVRKLNAGTYLILMIDERGAYAGFPFIKQ